MDTSRAADADGNRRRLVIICTQPLVAETLGAQLEATGDWNKVSAMIDLLKPFGIREIVRTGTVAIARLAEQTLDEEIAEMIAAAEA